MRLFSGRRPRPRRRMWEDDGIAVPWLSALVAVYLVAMLNTEFWREAARIVALTSVSAAGFHASLLVVLVGLYALVLNCIMIRGTGAAVPALLVLLASLVDWLTSVAGVWIVPSTLLKIFHGDLGPVNWHQVSLLWKVGLMGVLPSAVLLRVRIGRRYLARELVRRGLFALLCLMLAGAAVGLEHQRLVAFFQTHPRIVTLLNPGNVFAAGAQLLLHGEEPERVPIPGASTVLDKNPPSLLPDQKVGKQ